MEVDRKTAIEITREIEAAANAIFAKYGLEKKKLNTKYGESYSLSISAEKVSLGENGVNFSSTEAKNYTMFHSSYELPAGLLGKKFRVNGKEYAFAGIATSRPKYPLYALDINAGTHSFFTESVKRLLVEAK